MNIVIVESPAKAKTINKYLGDSYKVIASYGHVRDLPAKTGSVLPDDDFTILWKVNVTAEAHLKEIIKSARHADHLILATDPDREGEAISWHVLEILKAKGLLKDTKVERVVFNAITKSSVLNAIQQPRQINMALVEAYLARRALDYLVGFTLSPVLWRKMPGARSAGRVQSVALRIICDREEEIETFISQEYWTLLADISSPAKDNFTAQVVSIGDQNLTRLSINTQEQAEAIRQAIETGSFTIDSIETKPYKQNPYPPLITSTMQQDASRQLGMSASSCMRIAQRLYEGINIGPETQGLITYMRTDGVQIAPEAIQSCREVIAKNYGKRYLPSSPRIYKTKAKNAQEAHEAIRPTDLNRTPRSVAKYLTDDEARLYELIWKRTIASQMAGAELSRTTIKIGGTGSDGISYGLRSTGSVMTFDGFRILFPVKKDENNDEEDTCLPHLLPDDNIIIERVNANQHFTKPLPRYTEAALIKEMEKIGIGRPSTYATTLTVLHDREYVKIEKKLITPMDRGRLVTAFLKSFFSRYVEYDFTANLEMQLDMVSDSTMDWKALLRDFWHDFKKAIDDTKDLRISSVLEELNTALAHYIFPPSENSDNPRQCPSCTDGILSLKIGKFGTFIGCSNYPDCRHIQQLSAEAKNSTSADKTADCLLGIDKETGRNIHLKVGIFGPYVQRDAEKNAKHERASIPPGMDITQVDLVYALKLLSLPREIGEHPETGKIITAGNGRYGPFLLHDGVYANLKTVEDIFTIDINQAVSTLTDKQNQTSKKKQSLQTPLHTLGEHSKLGGPIHVMKGRYGPYVKHNKINATLPRNTDPDTLTLEQAIELIDAKVTKTKKPVSKGKAKTTAGKTKSPVSKVKAKTTAGKTKKPATLKNSTDVGKGKSI